MEEGVAVGEAAGDKVVGDVAESVRVEDDARAEERQIVVEETTTTETETVMQTQQQQQQVEKEQVGEGAGAAGAVRRASQVVVVVTPGETGQDEGGAELSEREESMLREVSEQGDGSEKGEMSMMSVMSTTPTTQEISVSGQEDDEPAQTETATGSNQKSPSRLKSLVKFLVGDDGGSAASTPIASSTPSPTSTSEGTNASESASAAAQSPGMASFARKVSTGMVAKMTNSGPQPISETSVSLESKESTSDRREEASESLSKSRFSRILSRRSQASGSSTTKPVKPASNVPPIVRGAAAAGAKKGATAAAAVSTAKYLQFGLPIKSCPRIAVTGYKEKIPSILVLLKDDLVKHDGLKIEGIFRVAPSKDDQEACKLQVDKGLFKGSSTPEDCVCVAAVLKEWFRLMPIRLLNVLPRNIIANAADAQVGKSGAEIMRGLTEPNNSVFCWLLDLLVETASLEEINRMAVKSLAIVMAPNLYKCADETDIKILMSEMDGVVAVVEKTLKWRIDLFKGPKFVALY